MGRITTKCMKKSRFYSINDQTGRFVLKSMVTGRTFYLSPEQPQQVPTEKILPNYHAGLFAEHNLTTPENWEDYNPYLLIGSSPFEEAEIMDYRFETNC